MNTRLLAPICASLCLSQMAGFSIRFTHSLALSTLVKISLSLSLSLCVCVCVCVCLCMCEFMCSVCVCVPLSPSPLSLSLLPTHSPVLSLPLPSPHLSLPLSPHLSGSVPLSLSLSISLSLLCVCRKAVETSSSNTPGPNSAAAYTAQHGTRIVSALKRELDSADSAIASHDKTVLEMSAKLQDIQQQLQQKVERMRALELEVVERDKAVEIMSRRLNEHRDRAESENSTGDV